jgi:hypothetical protein
MKTLIYSLVLIFCFVTSNAQTQFNILWQKCYGGSEYDYVYSIQQTTDGGYLVAGNTESNDGDVTGNHGSTDYWIININQYGEMQWQKCYGGGAGDFVRSFQQTTDGGCVIAGTTSSNDGNVTGNHGSSDYWIVKLDQYGELQWQKCFGGSNWDEAHSIQQTTDSGYVIAGTTSSNDGDVTGNHGSSDYWIVKLDQYGELQWQKCFGGSNIEGECFIQQTTDGDYLVAGNTESNDGDVTGNHGSTDYWIINIDQYGEMQWQKCYGGGAGDFIRSFQQTTDSGYVIAGTTSSNDGDVTGNHGNTDYWIVKLDQYGELQWQKCFGGSNWDEAHSIQQTTDSGYVIAGWTDSNDDDVTENHGWGDEWIVKLSQSGEIQFQKCFGGSDNDNAISIQQTTDSGYVVAGYTNSNDGDVTGNHGGLADYWVVKLCNGNPLSISISDSNYCFSTSLFATSGFESYLWSTGDTSAVIEVTSGGIYSVTGTNSAGCPSEATLIVPDPLQPYNEEQICLVTFDTLTDKNVIVVKKTLNVGTDSILFYRLNNLTSQYQWIGSIGIDSVSLFIDNSSIPAQQNYQYKISIRDTCGSESELSSVHRTVLLQANVGINYEVNLFWNPYEGFSYLNFEIYRSVAGGEFILIANVPNNTYTFTDLTPPTGAKKYEVRVTKETSCNPTRAVYSYVSSNIINIEGSGGLDETQFKSFRIYPNPAVENITVEWDKVNKDFTVQLTDVYCRQLSTYNARSGNNKLTIPINNLQSGIYILRINGLYSIRFVKQ